MLKIQHHIDFTSLNTFHLISTVDNFCTLSDLTQLAELCQAVRAYSSYFVLGGGSNLIAPLKYDGLIIHNQLLGISVQEFDDDFYRVSAMAGENWDNFVAYCCEHGAYGLENLSLIPGTVGASPVQNIGAYGVEVKDFIESVTAFDFELGQFVVFSNAECDFSYRNSMFKHNHQYLVTEVCFKLPKKSPLNASYGDIAKYLSVIEQPTALDLRNAIIATRQSKLPNPDEIGNAGSFFHNPIIDTVQSQELKQKFPNLPIYPQPNSNFTKISAGWLIDNLGLKGYRLGNVGVYEKQALVLVNHGGADKHELLELVKFIQQQVKAHYNIQLNIEPISL